MLGYLYLLAYITSQYIILNLFNYSILKVFPLDNLKGSISTIVIFKKICYKRPLEFCLKLLSPLGYIQYP